METNEKDFTSNFCLKTTLPEITYPELLLPGDPGLPLFMLGDPLALSWLALAITVALGPTVRSPYLCRSTQQGEEEEEEDQTQNGPQRDEEGRYTMKVQKDMEGKKVESLGGGGGGIGGLKWKEQQGSEIN